MPYELLVPNDVHYTVGGENEIFVISARNISVGRMELISEARFKEDVKTYRVTLSADTSHGHFKWVAEVEQGYGAPEVNHVEIIEVPNGVKILKHPELDVVECDTDEVYDGAEDEGPEA